MINSALTHRLSGIFLVSVGLAHTALADDNRPVVVQMVEVAPDTYRIGVRAPPSIPPVNRPSLVMPQGFKLLSSGNLEVSSRSQFGGNVADQMYHCDAGLSFEGEILELRYPVAPPSIATVIRIEWLGGQSKTVVVAPGELRLRMPGKTTRSTVASDYLRLGIHHIWVGTDHLLFLLCLIFISGSVRRILLTITGFTIAHSATLALSALEVVHLPTPPIEAVIALSVVFLATEVTKGRRSNLTWRHPIAVSGTFGLLHGLGFAAVLNEVGLPSEEVVTGLLFFNLGVETGQVLFAVLVLASITLVKWSARSDANGQSDATRDRVERGLRAVVGNVVGCVAAFWMFERLAGFFA